MTTTAMKMYWKPDKEKMLVSSMLGKLAVPKTVELRGIYLVEKQIIIRHGSDY